MNIISQPPASKRMLGAGYVAALLSEDPELVDAYHAAFTEHELLTAVDRMVLILGRRVARYADTSPTEVGDAFVKAARTADAADL